MTNKRQSSKDSRQVVSNLNQVCRQAIVFLQGKSLMDKARMLAKLRDVTNQADKFLEI